MKVVVIGAGAAGLMAAAQAAAAGASVLLLEKNDRPGKKLLITGNGRCNLTNTVPMPNLIKCYPGNGPFLFSCLSSFGSKELRDFFRQLGLETKAEKDGRVFPATDKAADVVETLVNYCLSRGVVFRYNSAVTTLTTKDGRISSVSTRSGKVYPCDAAVLATGGASYPGTGSTGDGYRLAAELGHTVVPLKPALVPLVTKESWVKELKRVSLKDVLITVRPETGRPAGERGEMVFTHFGISGPAVLTLSSKLAAILGTGRELALTITLFPGADARQLDTDLVARLAAGSNKHWPNILDELMPRSLVTVIARLAGMDPAKPAHRLTRGDRQQLLGLMQALPLTVVGTRPLQEAMVTAGGVSVKEVNPKTMESRLVKRLYLAGEVVDVDGYTGGFNLQAAFSMGYAAGIHAARAK